ncbi:MAG: lactate racemase domain-containing protein [Planctomycetaceae bacterium]
MSSARVEQICLNYGNSQQLVCEVGVEQLVSATQRPAPLADPSREIQACLQSPLDYPPLEQALISEDRILLALDHNTPVAAQIIAELWTIFASRSVRPENVLILQPPGPAGARPCDPRERLPADVRSRVAWKLHDPHKPSACAYLASSMSSERIYLAHEVCDADMVISIGPTSFDALLGHRGTSSVFYPGLSTAEAVQKAHGQGHEELGPDDDRPLRQLTDEIAWMMGTQFTIQTVSAAQDQIAHIVAGAVDSVFQRTKRLLAEHWKVHLSQRVDTVIAAVDAAPAGYGWHGLCAALTAARSLVTNGGRVVILSDLDEAPAGGIQMIRNGLEATDALKPLRLEAPDDLVPATQLVNTLNWANVYLLSRLDEQLVEDLFMVPIVEESEVQRLLTAADNCVFLASAQNVCGVTHS